MAETQNIGRIAELVSDDIFRWFKWKTLPVKNENWKCVTKKHKKKTHPSDVVFYYQYPYSNEYIYLNTDLKSYAKSSITREKIESALVSLGLATQCANISPDWKELFEQPTTNNYDVRGLLFLYNHDGEYDKSFPKTMRFLDLTKIKMGIDNMLYFLSPDKISKLHNIASDIMKLSAKKVFNDVDDYTFFYPDLVSVKNVSFNQWDQPATLEQLSAGWLILKYRKEGTEGYVVYYLRKGEKIEEFVYLLDYLSHYQLLISDKKIEIKLVDSIKNAANNFEKAKAEYLKFWDNEESRKARFETIIATSITNYATSFSTIEIGMGNE